MSALQSLELRRLFSVDLSGGFGLQDEVVGAIHPIVVHPTITNNGDAATAGPIAYRVLLATDDAGTQNVVVLANGTRPALAAGEGESFDATYDVPAALAGTSRNLIFQIDPDNAIAETNETNNDGIHEHITLAKTIGSDGVIPATDGDDYIVVGTLRDDLFYVTGAAGYSTGTSGDFGVLIGKTADIPHLTVDLKAGNDRFYAQGLPVAMSVLGGEGNDTIISGEFNDTIDAGAGDDSVWGDGGNDVIAGGVGNDTLIGFNDADTLSGGDGNDVLFGLDGDDQLDGNAGNDVIDAGGGSDRVDAGDGNDYVRGDGQNKPPVYDPYTLDAGNDTIAGGAGRDTIHGDGGDDQISGGSGGDSLNGEDGNDTLLGQGGNDRLRGSAGNDRLIGGAGSDRFDAGGDNGIDTISGDGGRDTAVADASDLLASIEVIRRS